MRGKDFTEEEDKIILSCVQNNSTKVEAFKEAALKLDRPEKSVNLRYYQKLYIKSSKSDNVELQQKRNKLLEKWLTLYPTNLTYAFKQVAKETGSKPTAISMYYYTTYRKKYNNVVTCGSKKGTSNNVKNTKRNLREDENDVPKQELQDWMRVIHIFLELPTAQQSALKVLFQTI